MPDHAAHTLDTLLKSLPHTPEYEYRHLVTTKAATEINPGERSDVSWISTESPDRTREVVVAKGMNDTQFQGNPIVTLGHASICRRWANRCGAAISRRRARRHQGQDRLSRRPETWPAQDAWPPDQVFALIQAGLLQGKSIGFLPVKVHIPDSKEVQKNDWDDNVGLVIDEWLLLEYACVFLPANQDALVESVAKGSLALTGDVLHALGLGKQLFGDGDGGSQERSHALHVPGRDPQRRPRPDRGHRFRGAGRKNDKRDLLQIPRSSVRYSSCLIEAVRMRRRRTTPSVPPSTSRDGRMTS